MTQSRRMRFCGFTTIHLLIVVAFLALLYGAYQASPHDKQKSHSSEKRPIAQTLSNGTHSFAPTTILISLDGFRADFVFRNLTPTLNSFVREGVSPRYMMPSFPSLTFPNHFTLVTGKYPESHGIVGNTFWDPVTEKEFYYTDPARSMVPEWWNAEPVWETAELAGLKTAIHMWPGSEAHIGSKEPMYVDKFNEHEPLDRKVQRVLGWLDLPGPNDTNANEETPRPQLMALYVPNVDADGHKYGPNSTYIRSTIREVDGMLGALFQGIDKRNLTDIVNIIVVSDHGMATTSNNRLIQLDDLIDMKLIEHIDGWPLNGLRPYDSSPDHLKALHQQLLAKSKEHEDAFDVYLRDEDMPARYHFSNNLRIAPLWIVPKAGWVVVERKDFDIAASKVKIANGEESVFEPRGLHGYDHEHPLMRAIFIARGPAFPHEEGSMVEPFQNTEVYNIVCDSLGLEPKPNNGTIRLPFQTKGIHNWDQVEIPHDFSADDGDDAFAATRPDVIVPVESVPAVSSSSTSKTPLAPPIPDATEEPTVPNRPVVHDGEGDGRDGKHSSSWWKWWKSKWDDVKDWANGVFTGSSEEQKTGEKTRRFQR